MNAEKFNMVAGCAIGSLLVFLLLGFFGAKIFGTSASHSHDEPLAFAIEIEEDDTEEVVEQVDYAALVASADVGAGEKLFRNCAACHKMDDGANGVGPHLWGIVGREIAAVGEYGYSNALTSISGVWDLENLSGFLENPKSWAPGTKMGYGGMDDPEDRVNLIAWMNEADGSPVELAAAPAETATEATEETAAAEEGEPAENTEAESDAADEAAETSEEASEETTAAGGEASEEAAEAPTDATEETVEEDTAPAEPVEEAAEEATQSSEAAEQAEEASEELAVAANTATEEVTQEATEAPQETEEAATAPAETEVAAAGGAYAALIANASAKQGRRVFRKCRACHKVDEGQNSVGPSLYGIINKDIASTEGFSYSDALAAKDGAWTLENLMGFLEAPKSWAPGTKMGFGGLKDEEDRINVITYLNEADGSPEPLQ
ncbi:MAG: cytochrome c family protein [Pseudomonadota bacterium]